MLTGAQRAALDHVTVRAQRGADRARLRIGPGVDAVRLIAGARHGRVSLNFHPDRLLADGRTVADSLAGDGVYRGQYETGISNGSPTAAAGGDRDRWEERLFGGAYHAGGVLAGDRPKYGALNLLNHPDGASPRFGSCHVRLRPSVNGRCTFTVGDSHLGPADVGTFAAFECVLAGLLERSRSTGKTLGTQGIDPVALLRDLPRRPVGASPAAPPGRSLDDYIEAQVHGPVDLAVDAEALVLDPSFAGTPTAAQLEAAAGRCGVAIEWHAGFELAAAEFGPDFRGPEVPPFARTVVSAYAGRGGILDAAVVGRAAASVVRDPAAWASWGSRDEVLQLIKYLWHTLVQYGHSARSARPD